jgi:hypothetical protein
MPKQRCWLYSGDKKYLIRGQWTPDQLRRQFRKFQEKFPSSELSFEQWLVERGKVYFSKPI